MAKKKNPHAVALGRKGGKAKSPAKSKAAKDNIQLRWDRIRAQKKNEKGP